MHSNRSTCQLWRASALTALCATVFIVKFTAASQTQSDPKPTKNFHGVDCDGRHEGAARNTTMSQCQLAQMLSKVSNKDLKSIYEYYKGGKDEVINKEPNINPEAVKWGLLIFGIVRTAQRSLIAQIISFVVTKNRDHACYQRVGCFLPGNRMGLDIGGPVTPDEAEVKFYYYNRSTRSETEVNLENMDTVVNGTYGDGKLLRLIFHGFKEHHHTKQVVALKNALLNKVPGDVIVVDWGNAAPFPWYGAAAANTPMVGAKVSMFLQALYYNRLLTPENVHLIGFSLGAHAAGFCGRHFKNSTKEELGRISGLDPAGLLFENPNVALSYTDASFVDVIHTSGGTIYRLQFGRYDPMGHVDFYPNGGEHQPGCTSGITCSHNRAWWLYIDSVNNSDCPFKSIQCQYGWSGYNVCLNESSHISANMSFYNNNYTEKGSYYLRTKEGSPFCILDDTPDPRYIRNDTTPAKPPR